MHKTQKIIIDGYNVIHADGELKRCAQKDLNRSRVELIKRLKTYLQNKAVRMTLVFDGRGGLTDVEMILPAKLQVMYSPVGQTADELIITSLRSASNPREYIVITSDAADIGKEARSLGAEVVSSEDFLKRIGYDRRQAETESKEKPAPNEDDTAFWLRVFSKDGERRKEAKRKQK